MVKVVIEISSARHLRKEIRQFDTEQLHIGRGYQNDIIIQDPYVSAQHLVIRQAEEGWVVEDLQSRNGIFRYDKKARRRSGTRTRLKEPYALNSGDLFFIGQTALRIFLPEHKVAPAKHLEGRGLILQALNTPWVTACAVAGFFVLYYIDLLLTHPYVEISYGQIIFTELLVFIAVMIWSGIWAFIGRMVRQRARFLLHLSMSCLFLIVILPLTNVAQFLGFLFASAFVEALALMICGGAAFTMLLVSHEAVATFLSLRSRVIFSSLVPFSICALGAIGYIAWQAEFQPQPQHYVRLNPPFIQPFHVKTPEKFLKKLPDISEGSKL